MVSDSYDFRKWGATAKQMVPKQRNGQVAMVIFGGFFENIYFLEDGLPVSKWFRNHGDLASSPTPTMLLEAMGFTQTATLQLLYLSYI